MQLPKKREAMAVEIPTEFADIFNLQDNMEGVIPRLPQIDVIHKAQMFGMPDETKVETFEGIILDQHPANAYWIKAVEDSDMSSIPDCFSNDGKTPAENRESKQAEHCDGCPNNEYGSDVKGKGKACKNMKRLMILMENSLLPRRLSLSPASLGKDKAMIDDYLTSLTDRGLPYRAVVTKVLAKKAANEQGFEYSKIYFEKVRVLAKEELMEIGKLVMQYKEGARAQEIRADEYMSKTEEQNTSFDPDELESENPAQNATPFPENKEKPKNGFFDRFKKEKPESDIPFE
jgi:hypothetical protein